ncbi:hypothetical protein ATV_gp05 [Bicaudavirus pozzuoliense]|uniref:Uncharacterized protein ORF48 n=2 Tax=Acidianus two-tailed virus TaxID=315953 RepID=Y048_ATV|nr:hypothetical protein ATV_gp05 [Acidianus two-tailed virus]Q3V4T3.1 RecName: Full=Uncharacterized protein ORF48 [Acidianus two-tailed virus]CAI59881.1 hypothetical protein [Acidianus two-tailed virus]
MNCLEILISKGYNMQGYSPDTLLLLSEKEGNDVEECEAYFSWLEAVYG